MSTVVHFDFGAGQPRGTRLPRVALADVFELYGGNADERLVAGSVVIDLDLREGRAPTRVNVNPGAFLIRIRTPDGRLLMRQVHVERSRDPALVFLPKQRAPRPKKQQKAVDDLVVIRSAPPDALFGEDHFRKPAVPRDWWSALSMANTTEPVTISNLPGFHASELVEPRYDYMGIARLQAEPVEELLSLDGPAHDVTARLVGDIAAVQGAKLRGNRESPFAKWKLPVRNRELIGKRSDEGKGARYFSLSYRAEGRLTPLQVACVPGRWEKRDGKLADVYANHYERDIGVASTRALRVEVDDPDLGGLLDFLQQGDLSGSTRMLNNATELLYRKWQNPYASAAAGYVLVQAGQWQGENVNWTQWVLNLAHRYPSLTDGAILFTTLLLQGRSDTLKNLNYEGGSKNRFRTAISAAFEAVRRGPPLYRHGLKMMATNLAILEGEATGDRQTYLQLRSASKYIRELSMRVDPSQPFCVFDVSTD
ncbi:hypothetical protein [Caballeronia novacaledonica]|uniref:Uncharacterized protein n=1 Tax=Caballeronia novacaledonica TaxID=1544861 RepID=A0AA37II41_9BURK|nr:hypothetical protein [Caballeronia novacaledonica]GJH29073.1 hypothetical protein CBA19CS42_31175 [Caballeronia novacaledonica]